MRKNQEKMVTTTDLRFRTASAVLKMLGGKSADNQSGKVDDVIATQALAYKV
jgi:hypothetical protein